MLIVGVSLVRGSLVHPSAGLLPPIVYDPQAMAISAAVAVPEADGAS